MMQKQGHSLLLLPTNGHRVVSSTFEIVQILVQLNFDLVYLLLALEATEPVSEPFNSNGT